ncbi:hypothetical protein PWT90_07323 [Aphanocladium album]|nr:hypothetical protein PWT90_07323 [Aphanocladium album]
MEPLSPLKRCQSSPARLRRSCRRFQHLKCTRGYLPSHCSSPSSHVPGSTTTTTAPQLTNTTLRRLLTRAIIQLSPPASLALPASFLFLSKIIHPPRQALADGFLILPALLAVAQAKLVCAATTLPTTGLFVFLLQLACPLGSLAGKKPKPVARCRGFAV